MPLLMSPVDGKPMQQVIRHGIELDVCSTSGGVWLDKGELEKLIALMREDDAGATQPSGKNQHRTHYDHDDDDDDDYRRHGHDGYKKKSKSSRLMELFDF